MTEDIAVFLARKNQIATNASSIRNLRLTETRVCIVWLTGSFNWPRKKIINVIREIRENTTDTRITSGNLNPGSDLKVTRNPATITSSSRTSSKRMYFENFVKDNTTL